MITYNIAGLFTHDNFILSKIINDNNLTNKKIILYGGTTCLWHGGRNINHVLPLDEINTIIDKYNSLGIGCRFVFSSCIITKDDLNDVFCNNVLKILNKSNLNGVIISSDILYDHISCNYKNLHIVSSIAKVTTEVPSWRDETPEYYDKLCKKYNMVVINPTRSNDFEFLSKIKNKDKIEILINSKCKKFCDTQGLHHKYVANVERCSVLNTDATKYNTLINEIMLRCQQLEEQPNCQFNICNYNDISKLIEMGFSNFKLEGREYELDFYKYDVYKYLYGILNRTYIAKNNKYTCSFLDGFKHSWTGGNLYSIGYSIDNFYIQSNQGTLIIPSYFSNSSIFINIFGIDIIEEYNKLFQ